MPIPALRRKRAIADLPSLFLATMLASALASPAARATDDALRQRLPQDEVIYFVLPDRFDNGDPSNDRGGLDGDRLATGFDPTDKGFYHGGDLAGLQARLDYIAALGATAIWLGPIYRNKPVQGRPGRESAGYHGYWITDFTDVDPHFGTRDELKALVDAAHARGIKVYLDIITNHTADVIAYRECEAAPCPYRSLADYPYSTRGGPRGARINRGFAGDRPPHQTVENFARLTRADYAYTPFVPDAERDIKVPAWLNDPIHYHNRGDSTFRGESSLHGDFAGLDDLFTENPRVVAGFIEIFGQWIDDFGIDGFRIDTARHVNPEFWQAFVPAMLERARARGIPNFHIFGEVYDFDAGMLARYTRVDGYPAVLDFAFQSAAAATIAGDGGTDALAKLFALDANYAGGSAAALQLPTFLGNHDMGRFAHFVRQAQPDASPDEWLRRTILGHALMFLSRGVPTIYSGDEQGFIGRGGDQDARQSLFPSRVASYNDDLLLGSDRTTADANFDREGPLFRAIAGLARLRANDPALRGGETVIRHSDETPGLFAFSRRVGDGETLVAFNTGTTPLDMQVAVDPASQAWTGSHGRCPARSAAPGSLRLRIAPLDYVVCRARR